MKRCRCLTNNPLLRLDCGVERVEFHPVSIPELFALVQAELEQGYRLLSHPLTGSIRPDITPYKSILLSHRPLGPDPEGKEVLMRAIRYTDALFQMNRLPPSAGWDAKTREDFQYVDRSLIQTALERAV